MSVYVPTVERELEVGFLCSITMAMGKFSMSPTWGRPYLGRYCCVKDGKVSFNSRRDLAAMVSKTNDDFPDPDTPVTTVICRFGILTVTCFRLFSVASLMIIWSKSCIFCNIEATKLQNMISMMAKEFHFCWLLQL